MSRPLFKCASLGSMEHVLPGKPNDYKGGSPGYPALQAPDGPNGANVPWSMQQELMNLRVSYVKLWVSWHQLAQGLARPPASYQEQAGMMDNSYGWLYGGVNPVSSLYPDGVPRGDLSQPFIRYLDQSIKLINDTPLWSDPSQRVGVILAVYQEAPTWSSWSGSGLPPSEAGTGKGPEQRFPSDLGANSPYGWFIRYLVARYNGGVVSPGPSTAADGRGNPDGAKIHVIEPLNEPNFEWWPQSQAKSAAIDSMKTCEYWCRYYSVNYGAYPIWTLGPSTADTPDDTIVGGVVKHRDYEWFSHDVAYELQGWAPIAPVRWSHHNYNDIEDGVDYASSRVRTVKQILDAWFFLEYCDQSGLNAGRPRDIWLTEGTYRMGRQGSSYYALPDDFSPGSQKYEQQVIQSARIAKSYEQMRENSTAVLWTQHSINDGRPPGGTYLGDVPTYAIREPWRAGVGPDRRRLAWDKLSRYNPYGPPDF